MTSAHLPGLILWLPKQDPSQETIPGMDEGAYNHPVVVLSAFARDGKVIMLPLTSFDETDLLERHRKSPHKRKSYLPIDPANAHPDNGISKHEISLDILRPYQRNAEFVLSKASYQDLIEYCGFQQPLPSPAPECVPGTFERIPTPYTPAHPPSGARFQVTRSPILDTGLRRWTDTNPTFLNQGRSHYTTHYGTVSANHHPGHSLAITPRSAQTYSVPDYHASRVGRSSWQSDAHARSNIPFQGDPDTNDPGCPVNIGVA
ncbi:hypothetical protein PG997_014033 [Apiospora hydei]|uniref:Uncharacterized protein n=1 Tax=Apiospora hydei TaxID=1337664 RepID=A0ABR1V7W6_9PEZI